MKIFVAGKSRNRTKKKNDGKKTALQRSFGSGRKSKLMSLYTKSSQCLQGLLYHKATVYQQCNSVILSSRASELSPSNQDAMTAHFITSSIHSDIFTEATGCRLQSRWNKIGSKIRSSIKHTRWESFKPEESIGCGNDNLWLGKSNRTERSSFPELSCKSSRVNTTISNFLRVPDHCVEKTEIFLGSLSCLFVRLLHSILLSDWQITYNWNWKNRICA